MPRFFLFIFWLLKRTTNENVTNVGFAVLRNRALYDTGLGGAVLSFSEYR